MTATAAPPLEADLVAGLKRLQLAHFRAVAAETLQTATTQRWTPEALLRAHHHRGDRAQRRQPGRPAEGGRVPGRQGLRRLPGRGLVGPTRDGRLRRVAGVAAGAREPLLDRPGRDRARAISWWPLARRPCWPASRSSTPSPPIWSRRSTEGWPTTPSARSSISCCATTRSWSTSWASRRWTTSARSCSSASSRPPTSADPGRRQPLAVRPVGALPPPAEHRRLAAGPPAPSRRHRRHRGRVVPHEGGTQPCGWPRRARPRRRQLPGGRQVDRPAAPSRNDGVTIACPCCARPFVPPAGRRRFCSDACRQAAWRRRHPTRCRRSPTARLARSPSTSARPATAASSASSAAGLQHLRPSARSGWSVPTLRRADRRQRSAPTGNGGGALTH